MLIYKVIYSSLQISEDPYFFHAHSYRSSAVILLKILIWRQRYNDKRTCTRLHRGYAYAIIELSGQLPDGFCMQKQTEVAEL